MNERGPNTRSGRSTGGGTVNDTDATHESELLERLQRLVKETEYEREVLDAKQAADFLRMPEAEFRRLAPSLPRHRISERRYVYLKRELLDWLGDR